MDTRSVDRSLTAALQPLLASPGRTAVFTDIDGTIAPITERADEALVPPAQQRALTAIAERFALAGCVSGRSATEARRLVGLGTLAYIGNHGCERILPGDTGVTLDPSVEPHAGEARAFAEAHHTRELASVGMRLEDKGPIVAFHWRGAADEPAAEESAQQLAAAADAEGLRTHWGRKVLEIRPAVDFDKGTALESLLGDHDVDHALYAGDDRTDIDAFAALGRLRERGDLQGAVRIAVLSGERPDDLQAAADVAVDSTDDFLAVLQTLAG
ncbi:MAG: trehalose-phosphatase [Solirubrobacterales bacterium]